MSSLFEKTTWTTNIIRCLKMKRKFHKNRKLELVLRKRNRFFSIFSVPHRDSFYIFFVWIMCSIQYLFPSQLNTLKLNAYCIDFSVVVCDVHVLAQCTCHLIYVFTSGFGGKSCLSSWVLFVVWLVLLHSDYDTVLMSWFLYFALFVFFNCLSLNVYWVPFNKVTEMTIK